MGDQRNGLADGRSVDLWGTLIIANGFCGDIFATQRRMRAQLLDSSFIRYAPARDLAAHMLLRLDDLGACWSIATDWLRKRAGMPRVDAGFGPPHARTYLPSLAEAKDTNYDVPTLGESAVDNHDPIMQAMWLSPRPVVFADIKQDRRFQMRQRLSKARTKTKIGGALRTGNGSYGLICADWTEHFAPNDSNIYDRFEQPVADVLGPINRRSQGDRRAGAPKPGRARAEHTREYGRRIAQRIGRDPDEFGGRGRQSGGEGPELQGNCPHSQPILFDHRPSAQEHQAENGCLGHIRADQPARQNGFAAGPVSGAS